MGTNQEEEILSKLERCAASMRESADRISRNVLILHRMNDLLEQHEPPLSKNVNVEDLKGAVADLLYRGKVLGEPNRNPEGNA